METKVLYRIKPVDKKSIEQYLDDYEIPKLTVYPLKKPHKIVIEPDDSPTS